MRLDEGFDACLSAIGADDFMAIGLERVTQRLQQQRIVVDDENAQRRGRRRLWAVPDRDCRRLRDRETHAHQRALAGFALDFQIGAVTLGDAVNHREPESGAARALGREEWLQAAPSRVLIHADALVFDIQQHDLRAGAGRESGADDERAALGHGIDRVEHEVDERVAYLALHRGDRRQIGRELGAHFDRGATLLRHVAPARAREGNHLADELVEIHGHKRQLRLAQTVELTHARHGLCNVIDRALDDFELRSSAWTQGSFTLEQCLGVQRHRRDGVVDVVCDAARHLPERAQALLLHDLLLRGPQVVVRTLQRAVQLRLIRGERGVLAGLAQEFTFAAAECVGCAPRA